MSINEESSTGQVEGDTSCHCEITAVDYSATLIMTIIVGLAVCMGLYLTRDPRCLFGLLGLVVAGLLHPKVNGFEVST